MSKWREERFTGSPLPEVESMPVELKIQLQRYVQKNETNTNPEAKLRNYESIKRELAQYSNRPWAKELYTSFPQIYGQGGISESPGLVTPGTSMKRMAYRYGPMLAAGMAAPFIAPASPLLGPAVGMFAGSQVGRALVGESSMQGVAEDALLSSGAPAGVALSRLKTIGHPMLNLSKNVAGGTIGSLAGQYGTQKISGKEMSPANVLAALVDAGGTVAGLAGNSLEDWVKGGPFNPMLAGAPTYDDLIKKYPALEQALPRSVYNTSMQRPGTSFDVFGAVGNDPFLVNSILGKIEGMDAVGLKALVDNLGINAGTMESMKDPEVQKFLMKQIVNKIPAEDLSKVARQQQVMDHFWGKLSKADSTKDAELVIKGASDALEALSLGTAKTTQKFTRELWKNFSDSVMADFGRALDPLTNIKDIRLPADQIRAAIKKVFKDKAVFGPTPGGKTASLVRGAMDKAAEVTKKNVDEALDALAVMESTGNMNPEDLMQALDDLVAASQVDGLTISQNAQALKDINRLFRGSRETQFKVGGIKEALEDTLKTAGKTKLIEEGLDPRMIDKYFRVREKYPHFARNRGLVEKFYKQPRARVADSLLSPEGKGSELREAFQSAGAFGIDDVYKQAALHLSGQDQNSKILLGGYRNFDDLYKAFSSGNPAMANRALEVFKRTNPTPELMDQLQAVSMTKAITERAKTVSQVQGQGMTSMLSPEEMSKVLDDFSVFKDSGLYKQMVVLRSRLSKAKNLDERLYENLSSVYDVVKKSQGPQGADAFLQVMTHHLRPGNESMSTIIQNLSKTGNATLANDLKHLLIGKMFYAGKDIGGGRVVNVGSFSNFVEHWKGIDKKLFGEMFNIPKDKIDEIDDLAKFLAPASKYMDEAVRGVHYIDSMGRRRASMGGFAALMSKPLLQITGLSTVAGITSLTSAAAITTALFAPTVIGKAILNNSQQTGINLIKFAAGLAKAIGSAGVEGLNAQSE